MSRPVDPMERLNQLYEVGVLVPLGLATVVGEQLPRLAEIGRRRVEGRVALARFIGQMVVEQGSREVKRRLEASLSPTTQDRDGDTSSVPAPAAPAAPEHLGPTQQRTTAVGQERASTAEVAATEESSAATEAVVDTSAQDEPGNVVSATDLAIEDYESLAASQVISLLSDLEPAELELIEAFEIHHRNRRTVLGRIAQIRSAT